MSRRALTHILAAGLPALLIVLLVVFSDRIKGSGAPAPELALSLQKPSSAPEEVKAMLGLPAEPEKKVPAFSGPEAKTLYGPGEKKGAVPRSTETPKIDYAATLRGFAEQGNVPAQNLLAESYLTGRGVKQDFTEAFKWFKRSADQGNAAALFNLGSLYYTGSGVKKDTAAALDCLKRSADGGYAPAQAALGAKYLSGEDLPKDPALGLDWLRKAGAAGYGPAQFQLGTMFYYGRGVPADKAEALKWFRLSGEGGNAQAQFNAGLMLARGDGVPQDYAESLKWLLVSSGTARAPLNTDAARAAAAVAAAMPAGPAAAAREEAEKLRARLSSSAVSPFSGARPAR